MAAGERMDILVLGVGGTVNQGIVKALRHVSPPVRVIGACVSAESAGLYMCDTAYLSPPAVSSEFFPWLAELCSRERVKLILTGVDAILTALAPRVNELRNQTGAVALVSSPEALAIANDKLTTARWLASSGFAFPRSAAAENAADCDVLRRDAGFPLFAKPRRSRGSKGVLRIDDDADLEYVTRRADYVVQQYLGDTNDEYTAGCFATEPGTVAGTIVMQRRLDSGSTVRASVADRPDISAAAHQIAAALGAVGPCNLQFRIHDGQPVCFDINLRFSSTTPMRSRLGFREVEAAVRLFALGEPVDELLRPHVGVALRYWNEIYVAPEVIETLRRERRLDTPGEQADIEGVGDAQARATSR